MTNPASDPLRDPGIHRSLRKTSEGASAHRGEGVGAEDIFERVPAGEVGARRWRSAGQVGPTIWWQRPGRFQNRLASDLLRYSKKDHYR